jgi:hypothetical protein
MRKLICLSIFLLIGISCFAQELEMCGSFSTSSEIRFQDALGVGLQYHHDISKKLKIGLGTHYYYKNSLFTEEYNIIGGGIGDVNHWTTNYDSKSQRVSLRLNIQCLLRDNEYLSISLGPEISYNFIWGKEDGRTWAGGSESYKLNRYINLEKKIGIGLISKIEIKDFITHQLSLCFTLRPELVTGKDSQYRINSPSLFSGNLGFVEFQMGVKYRFKNQL